MIRNLVVTKDLACVMLDGMATCNAAMEALILYFREYVYKSSKTKFIHSDHIDDQVISIMTAAVNREEPHLKSLFKVRLQRDQPTDYVMDVVVEIDDVYLHLIEVTEGSFLCH
jgi:hypothetical protein